jgi:hypothetical protein
MLNRKLHALDMSLEGYMWPIAGSWQGLRRAIDCCFESAAPSFGKALRGNVVKSLGPTNGA